MMAMSILSLDIEKKSLHFGYLYTDEFLREGMNPPKNSQLILSRIG